MKKNVAGQVVGAQMVSASDHSAFTSAVTVYITKDNGTQTIGSGSGACVHKGNGFHTYEPTQTETNANHLAFTFIGSGAIPTTVALYTSFPQSADAPTSGAIADAVWDEVLTGATHNVNASAGKRLRQLASSVILGGNVTAATSNTVSLDADASSTNGEYDPALILIDSGAGAGQCRLILQYNGSTKTAVVDRNWRVNPDDTSTYVLIVDPGREHVNEGLAQAGTNNTITLNTSASSYDNAYVGQVVFIRSGTGQDQARRVLAYNGTSKIAAVRAWDVNPDTTSAYVMLPTGKWSNADIANAVWDEASSLHVSAGSTGLALRDTDLRGARTVGRGTVASVNGFIQFTVSALSPAGAAEDQFRGRIIIFDADTTTAALRGQATDITANTAAALPQFTFTALTTAPVAGDTFSIV